MEKQYLRFSSPNKARLAALLDRARGPRTMKRFADDCGVNPSTFSRIYNQVNKGASSEELIRVIAEHADPESGVTLDMLMEANGFIADGNRMAVRQLQEKLVETAKSVLCEKLSELTCREINIECQRYPISKSMSIRPDIVVGDVVIDGKRGQWLVDVLPPMIVFSSSGAASERHSSFMLARRIQDRLGRYLAAYCMAAEDVQISRISMAVFDEQEYETILEHYSKMKSDDSVSFILVNVDKHKIEDEYVLPDRTGRQGESLFNCSQEDDGEPFDGEYDGIYWDEDFKE